MSVGIEKFVTSWLFDPFRCDAAQVGVHGCAAVRVQAPCNLEDRAERAPFARNPVIGRDDLLKSALLIADEQGPEIHHRPQDRFGRPVGRTAVGIDQRGTPAWTILHHIRADGTDHMPDHIGLVVTGDTDKNLHVPDGLHP
jgi:hypothetical protein